MEQTHSNNITFQSGKVDLMGMNTAEGFNLFDYHFRSPHNILLSYKGPFENTVINMMVESIRDILSPFEVSGKKTFKIFIELAQNIAFYSYERNLYCKNQAESGVGTIVMLESPESFHLVSGNIIKNTSVPILQERCEQINQLDLEGLRSFKRRQMELPSGENGGANVGLIHIAITSLNPLEFTIFEINEAVSFFALSVTIKK
jgi:hypothetical protein